MLQLKKSPAFSLLELILVTTIILILATAALTGTGTILEQVKLSTALNKAIFNVQQARTRATTAGDTGAQSFAATFAQGEMRLVSRANNVDTIIETTALAVAGGIEVLVKDENNAVCATAEVIFTKNTSAAQLACDNHPISKNTLRIGLQLTGKPETFKSFFVHKVAGVPQI